MLYRLLTQFLNLASFQASRKGLHGYVRLYTHSILHIAMQQDQCRFLDKPLEHNAWKIKACTFGDNWSESLCCMLISSYQKSPVLIVWTRICKFPFIMISALTAQHLQTISNHIPICADVAVGCHMQVGGYTSVELSPYHSINKNLQTSSQVWFIIKDTRTRKGALYITQ